MPLRLNTMIMMAAVKHIPTRLRSAAIADRTWQKPLAMSVLLMGLSTQNLSAAEPSASPSAEPPAPRAQWTIQVDPLTYALGLTHVQVEHRLSPDWSVYAGPNLRLFDGLLDSEHQPYVGIGVEVGVRRFFSGKAPEGGWIEARGVLARLSTTEGVAPASALGGYGSLLVGYTAILGQHFVLAGGLGGQYLDYHVSTYGFGGFFPAAHTALGVAF